VHQLAGHLLAISASRAEQKFHSELIGRARKQVVGWLEDRRRCTQRQPVNSFFLYFCLNGARKKRVFCSGFTVYIVVKKIDRLDIFLLS